tara:strand:+ start:103 stop:540 length:438 start_codon:yes stop_codon:yes gene_type:complete
MNKKWDKRYLDVASNIAQWSKDPSSKIGAVAVGDKGQILAQGFNGFPRNIKDWEERLKVRETKYKFMIHAEMNAIYNATYNGVSLDGATLYVHGLPCCANCALGVIQVGIKRVVMRGNIKPQWEESFEMTKQLFNEANVEWEFIK